LTSVPSEKWDHIPTATEVWRTVCHKLPCNRKNQRQRNLVYVKISVSLQILCIEENKQKLQYVCQEAQWAIKKKHRACWDDGWIVKEMIAHWSALSFTLSKD